ncbi:4Fe-4S binding protein [Methanobrevibacter filiformis]|uniref:Ferredoxin n=1 Tax=Methanobrevibacter filiformis TaxID=55758 RepID=A0A166EW59_9EURY|nr:4Fe-4S binding protein [Methanobrevibacter filiformis]KZX17078.1 ferredoxin [Methanobrevibacter filiformis]
MELTFKKQIETLRKEVILKSADLDDDIDDFNVDIGDYTSKGKTLAISPRCVRCDLCVIECPVGAISSSTSIRRSRVKDNCVKCEICAQTCPVSCIYVMETNSIISSETNLVSYNLVESKVPHRTLKMEKINVDTHKCVACGTCKKFCPTKAITIKNDESEDTGEVFESINNDLNETLDNNLDETDYPELYKKYSHVKKEICIGCGSCANLCPQSAISLKRTLGSVIVTKNLQINEEACVGCYLCEDSCPVDAIKLKDDLPVLDEDICIRCNVCSTKCPVNALKLEFLDK